MSQINTFTVNEVHCLYGTSTKLSSSPIFPGYVNNGYAAAQYVCIIP